MLITKEWLERNKTKRGGYTKRQLEILAVDWPPEKGWASQVAGKEISDDGVREFEGISDDSFD